MGIPTHLDQAQAVARMLMVTASGALVTTVGGYGHRLGRGRCPGARWVPRRFGAEHQTNMTISAEAKNKTTTMQTSLFVERGNDENVLRSRNQ